jgi:hypothetical protein
MRSGEAASPGVGEALRTAAPPASLTSRICANRDALEQFAAARHMHPARRAALRALADDLAEWAIEAERLERNERTKRSEGTAT